MLFSRESPIPLGFRVCVILYSYFTMDLNDLSADYKKHAAPTDSRRRPDQRFYEEGRVDAAIEHKNRLEEKQRY